MQKKHSHGKFNPRNILARKLKVNYEEPKIDRYWVNGDAFLTHWMNAYTLTIPEGEKFNVRNIQPFIHKIQNDTLRTQAKGFIAQELSHGRAHEEFIDVIQEHGYNTLVFSRTYNFISFKILEPSSPLITRLAFVVAVERINELLAEITLESNLLDNSPESVATLYKWHFAEEIEHKSIVFDIYNDVSGNRLILTYSTLMCYIFNLGFLCLGTLILLIQDGSILAPKTWIRGFRFFFSREKFFWRVSKGCFDLLRPSFHPSKTNNDHLASPILASRTIGPIKPAKN